MLEEEWGQRTYCLLYGQHVNPVIHIISSSKYNINTSSNNDNINTRHIGSITLLYDGVTDVYDLKQKIYQNITAECCAQTR